MGKLSKHEFIEWLEQTLNYQNFSQTCKAAKFRYIYKEDFEAMKDEVIQILKNDPAYEKESKGLPTVEYFLKGTGNQEYANYKFISAESGHVVLDKTLSENDLHFFNKSKLFTDYVVVDSKRTVTKEGWYHNEANFSFDTVLYEITIDLKEKYPLVLEYEDPKPEVVEVKFNEGEKE